MPKLFNSEVINPLLTKLNHHPVYGALRNQEDLRRFMSHHVYSVWDFMSLVKYLQHKIAPSQFPWVPRGNATSRYFINSLVLEEESDESLSPEKKSYSSHFELYCQAMREIGGDPQAVLQFVATVKQQGIEIALTSEWIPSASRHFMQTTFEWIATDQPHLVAAALAMGREQVIPGMFRALLAQMEISPAQAPTFHYYLNRHIHLDEDFHGPLSLQLLNELCGGETNKIQAAEVAAQQAILARLRFWDEVLEAIKN